MKVLEGKNDRLFLDNDSNNVIAQVTGNRPLNDKTKLTIKDTFDFRRHYAELLGFKYIYFITPNAHCVYSEDLPDDIEVSDNRSAIYLRDNFSDIVFYPLELLRSHREKYTVYYKTDTHWTALGAALAFNDLSDRLNLNTQIDVDNIPKVEKTFTGDLGNKFSSHRTSKYHVLDWKTDVTLISWNRMDTLGAFMHLRSDNPNGKRCVVFGDSFFVLYDNWKVIGHYFAETYFFNDRHVFDRQLINKLNPDIVITLINERFFNGFFYSAPYIESLTSRILSRKSYADIEKIDLSDDIFSDGTRKLLANRKQELLTQRMDELTRENQKLKTDSEALRLARFEETKQLLEQNLERPILCCQVHQSMLGWSDEKFEGQVAGKSDLRRAIEAVKINFTSEFCSVKCAARTRKKGWLETVGLNETIGSTGQHDPLLGFKFELDEQGSQHFDILYCLHVPPSKTGGGWSEWFSNGQEATLEAAPFNAIRIRLRAKAPSTLDGNESQ